MGVIVRSILPSPAPQTDGVTIDEIVITGSFNWTNNALKNEENLNFIKSKALVRSYLDNWKEIVK